MPHANDNGVYYPFGSASPAIQADFNRFIASIKDSSGKISEAVHSIEVGNEIDLSNFGAPTPADTQVARIFWWLVNLERALDQTTHPDLYHSGQAQVLFTVPVSNADQNPNVIAGIPPVAGTSNTITILMAPSSVWNPAADWARTHLKDSNATINIQNTVDGVLQIGTPKVITGATDVVKANVNGAMFWETTLTIQGNWDANTGNPIPANPGVNPGTTYFVQDPQPVSWFQIFAGGTAQSVLNTGINSLQTTLRYIPPNTGASQLPDGPLSQFTNNWPGLREALGDAMYAKTFYNSYQSYQYNTGLQNLVNQYSNYAPNPNWMLAWPGEQFDVPLLFSETGASRLTSAPGQNPAVLSPSTQQDTLANGVVTPLEEIWKQATPSKPTNLMGYGIFEFNDEPNANDAIPSADKAIAWYGLYTYYDNTSDPVTFPVPGQQFRQATVLKPAGFHLASGTTLTPFETIFALHYDLDELFPVTVNGVSTAQRLKSLFTFGKVNMPST